MHRSNAFTLIELLVVVAIIGVLATIAVLNFMSALTRSKIAAVQGEFMNLARVYEMYHADYSVYYVGTFQYPTAFCDIDTILGRLTTPIAYTNLDGITDHLLYPYFDEKTMKKSLQDHWVPPFTYGMLTGGWNRFRHSSNPSSQDTGVNFSSRHDEFYIFHTAGPDRRMSIVSLWKKGLNPVTGYAFDGIIPYDISNGLYSEGDIVHKHGIAYLPNQGYVPTESVISPLYFQP